MFPARVFSAVRILAAAGLVAMAIPAGAVTSLAGVGQAAAAPAAPVAGLRRLALRQRLLHLGHGADRLEFDSQNHWLIDRGDGTASSVNLVVLSFVNPLRLLNGTTDATTLNGVPRGMTPDIVDYFTSRGVRVMLSIGGITYTDAWDQALATERDPARPERRRGRPALGVGIEIDYEQNTNPNLAGLQAFIDAYRSQHPLRRERRATPRPG